MDVLRLCSVYEAPSGSPSRGFDAIGGMQVHTARLTEALDRRGVRQTVLTAHRPGAEPVQRVGAESMVVRVGAPIRRFRQFYGLAAAPAVARTSGIDLVHVHLGEDLAILPLARWATGRLRVPLVATVHCSLRHTLVAHDARSAILRTIGGPAQTSLLRRASSILVLTERLAERLVGSGLLRSRVQVVPLGIDFEAATRPRPRSMDDGRWIVYAGRIVPEKGIRDLVAALARLRARDVGLIVVGDGADRWKLEAAAVGRRVRFVGSVPHEEVAAYLQHAAAVVVPSWFEERGRVVLEAMTFSIPVIATLTGGIPSSITDGVNGVLVPPRDPSRLAAAIDRVLGDETLATRIGAAGRGVAAEQGIDALADATLAAYERALDRGTTVPSPRLLAP